MTIVTEPSVRGGSSTILSSWEAGLTMPGPARCAALLSHLGYTETVDAALDLPLGHCAEMAMTASQLIFGNLVELVCECDHCGDRLELSIDLAHLRQGYRPPDRVTADITLAGNSVTMRAVTFRDLLAARTSLEGLAVLVQRCTHPAVHPEQLNPDEWAEIDSAAVRISGLAAASMVIDCPACDTAISVPLDISNLLWEQIDASARALLAEVSALSSAFGWSEQAVLDLTPTRRQAYLELISDRSHQAGQHSEPHLEAR